MPLRVKDTRSVSAKRDGLESHKTFMVLKRFNFKLLFIVTPIVRKNDCRKYAFGALMLWNTSMWLTTAVVCMGSYRKGV